MYYSPGTERGPILVVRYDDAAMQHAIGYPRPPAIITSSPAALAVEQSALCRSQSRDMSASNRMVGGTCPFVGPSTARRRGVCALLRVARKHLR